MPAVKIPIWFGVIVRLALMTIVTFDDFVWKIYISTPTTSFMRLQEGIYLFNNGVEPYDGGSFHQAPLLLLLGYLPDIIVSLIYVAMDYGIALVMLQLARQHVEDQLKEEWKALDVVSGSDESEIELIGETLSEEDAAFLPQKHKLNDQIKEQKDVTIPVDDLIVPQNIASLYLLNPLSIIACLAQSTQLFSNFGIACALYFSIKGQRRASMFFLGFATYMSLYPILILPACILLLQKITKEPASLIITKCISGLVMYTMVFLALSYLLIGNWSFIDQFYGMMDKPLLVALLLTGFVAIFKSYPSIADTALWFPLLMMHAELFKYTSQMFYTSAGMLACLALGPLMYTIWVYSGSGNSNFYFAITLVWAFAQITMLTDLVYAYLKRESERKNPGWRRMRIEMLYALE